MQTDTTNIIFQQAVAFINQTNKHLFLTGKAGTGKTTFLKYIVETCFKKMVVVAPTGVAAINAGGVTIHSFFQLPLGMYIQHHPAVWGGVDNVVYNKNQLLSQLRLNTTRRELIRELDLLVIDEVSMVRADLLDAVDTVLRSVRRNHYVPFGGVQMLFIGDLFQLPPVVKEQDAPLFYENYKSSFFFDSKVIQEAPPVYLELKKIYRQKDEKFIRLLNNIRNNCCTESDLKNLHAYYQPDFSPERGDGCIILTTHNYKADAINKHQLAKLPGRLYKFEAKITGEFPENAYPADVTLQLKIGAQIMFIKNDKGEVRKYYNGKIGIIKEIDDEEDIIYISFPGEHGTVELPLEKWRNVRYQYEQESDKISEEELGSFIQYPIRLAWAVTIHKSQGLTFDKAVIDAGASFAAGQVYVALSRLRSLDGLILHSQITEKNILTDSDVIAFSNTEKSKEELLEILTAAQEDFIRQSLLDAFDWKKIQESFNGFIQDIAGRSLPDKPLQVAFLNQLKESLLQQTDISEKFKAQLENLLNQKDKAGYAQLHNRVTKAAAWFTQNINEKITGPLQEHIKGTKIKSRTKKYVKEMTSLLITFIRKQEQIKRSAAVTAAMQQSGNSPEVMQCVSDMRQPVKIQSPTDSAISQKPQKGDSHRISLALYQEGKNLEQIAEARNLTRNTIEGHLSTFISSGEVDVHFLIPEDKLKEVVLLLHSNPDVRSSDIREKLGADFSYGEIRAAMEYWKFQKMQRKSSI